MENPTQITTPVDGELRTLVQDQYDRYLPVVAKTAPQLHRELLARSGEVASLSEEAFVDEKTSYLGLTLPHPFNLLERDVLRLREAFSGVDAYAQNTDLRVTEAEQELGRKADATTTATALQALGQRVDQVAGGIPKLSDAVNSAASNVAASSLAVKTAYERGTEGVNAAGAAHGAANAAHGAANAAQTTANEAKNVTNLVRTAPAAWCIPQAGADGKISAGWIGGGGTLPVGFPAFLPWRYNRLPPGWYFMNGTRYVNGSPQANALNALSAEFKADWGITNNGATTNVPNWFHTDGRGPTMRAVNGTSRQVGSVEDGAIQNITGSLVRADHRGIGGGSAGGYPLVNSGALRAVENPAGMWSNGGSGGGFSLYFNAADSVRTATETIMLNRGMTPAIFLGV